MTRSHLLAISARIRVLRTYCRNIGRLRPQSKRIPTGTHSWRRRRREAPMPKDNDAVMLQQMGNAITDVEVKFRASSLAERAALRPSLEQLLNDYADYRLRFLKEGVITT